MALMVRHGTIGSVVMPEATITAAIMQHIKEAKKRGAKVWCVKISGGRFQRPGIPDVLLCINGGFVGIEIKTERGVVSPLQIHEIEEIHNAGGVCAVVRSKRDFVKLFDKLLAGHSKAAGLSATAKGAGND